MDGFNKRISAVGLAGLVAAVVVACGGGGGGGNFAGIDRLGVTNGTITGFGSVFVNGVEYSTTGTTFSIDDAPGTQDNLQVGQQVTVQWSSSSAGGVRTAVDVFYDDTVEGPITTGSIDTVTQSFVVLGQTVVVDADTSFASPLFDLDSLADGDFVEVSGLLANPAGGAVVRATRIERKAAGEIEIRGVVSNRTTNTLNINAQVVNTATAVIDAPGGVISNGDFVEAKGTFLNGSNELVATRVELEDGDDELGSVGDEAEVEGYVTAFNSGLSFSVSGIPVQSNVIATGGTVALGAKVRVKGEVGGAGTIVADEVQVRSGASGSAVDSRIAAYVDSVDPAGGQLVLLGVTVQIDANTRLEDQSAADVRDFSLADIVAGGNTDFVEIRGVAQPNNTVRATLLQRQEPDDQGELRGPLASLSDPNFSILGVVVQTDGFTVFEEGDIDATEFFGGAVAVNDELEVKFAPNLSGASNPITADEVEIED
jgi:Domain of unknown function (DUF5666)